VAHDQKLAPKSQKGLRFCSAVFVVSLGVTDVDILDPVSLGIVAPYLGRVLGTWPSETGSSSLRTGMAGSTRNTCPIDIRTRAAGQSDLVAQCSRGAPSARSSMAWAPCWSRSAYHSANDGRRSRPRASSANWRGYRFLRYIGFASRNWVDQLRPRAGGRGQGNHVEPVAVVTLGL